MSKAWAPACAHAQAQADFDVFNLDDVDAAFARVTPLRYQQNMALRCGPECRMRKPSAAAGTWRAAAADAALQPVAGLPSAARRSPLPHTPAPPYVTQSAAARVRGSW